MIGALERADEDLFQKWLPLFEAFEAGAFWFFITDDALCITTIPDAVKTDSQNRLHCEDGPAFVWLKDIREYHWHGVLMPAKAISHPRSITVKQIEAEENAEIRRVLIEIYGQTRYLQDAGAQEIHRDNYGVLFRKELRGEILMMVQVVDATVLDDGTAREYFMPVDFQLRPLPDGDWPADKRRSWLRDQQPQEFTAHNAVASTFGRRGENYAPILES